MNVLNLVTNESARFYTQQVSALEENGVRCSTLAPPGEHYNGEVAVERSVTDYLQFYPSVLRNSFDEYDIVHANYGLTAPFAIAQPRRPVVLSLWGSELVGDYDWLTKLSKLCAPRCDAVIVMTDEMARELDHDCHVIPHGIDTEKFRPRPRREARKEVGWDPDSRHVLFPYSPHRDVKNYPRARRTVNAARDRVDDPVELQTVYGVPHEAMPTYMNAADVLLLTSESEGSPNSVKEALACNLPVVSTAVGDVPDRLSGVEPSRVCRSDAELLAGLVDVLADPRRSNGRPAVRDTSLKRMGEQIWNVYESVL